MQKVSKIKTTPPHFIPVPSQDLDLYKVFSKLMYNVDIGGIVDHHCFYFLS
jgi:hypothetical protein